MMLSEYLYSVVDGLRDVSVSEPEGEYNFTKCLSVICFMGFCCLPIYEHVALCGTMINHTLVIWSY